MSGKEKNGLFLFALVWVGQVVSMLGSNMVYFALMFWAFSVTGRATSLALVGFFSFLPQVILSPVAGALVDRLNRKMVMITSDLAAGLSSIVVFILFLSGNLEIWHLYITGAFAGAFGALQFPAYSAATTMLVPKKHYARASGMISMAASAIMIVAPILAGTLLYAFGSPDLGILYVLGADILTFTFAVGVLAFIPIPEPETSKEGLESRKGIVNECLFGFRYIFKRYGLLGLLMTFMITNFIANMAGTTLVPMIMSRTGNDPQVLSWIMSAFGAGGLLGGLVLTVWGGPKKKINGILVGIIAANLLGHSVLGLGIGGTSVMTMIWLGGAFMASFAQPFTGGSSQAIWQSKVPPDIQGKVFSARFMMALVMTPFGTLVGGVLADYVFEPFMLGGSTTAKWASVIVGTGPGAGMGLMFIISGVLGTLVALVAYSVKHIREIEDRIPDHDEVERSVEKKQDGPVPA